jgi:hypothetical protein
METVNLNNATTTLKNGNWVSQFDTCLNAKISNSELTLKEYLNNGGIFYSNYKNLPAYDSNNMKQLRTKFRSLSISEMVIDFSNASNQLEPTKLLNVKAPQFNGISIFSFKEDIENKSGRVVLFNSDAIKKQLSKVETISTKTTTEPTKDVKKENVKALKV